MCRNAFPSKVLILVDEPFTQRDYERYGVHYLSSYCDVIIFDCTDWIRPLLKKKFTGDIKKNNNYLEIKDQITFENNISNINEALAFDFLSNSEDAEKIRDILRRKNIPRTIFRCGILPHPIVDGSLGFQVSYWVLILKEILSKILKILRMRATNRIGGDPDIVVVSGKKSLSRIAKPKSKIIEAHSFDYEIFRGLKGDTGNPIIEGEYAVFLDEDMVFHSDYLILNLKAPASQFRYYKSMNLFFQRVKDEIGMPVVIAGHPRADKNVVSKFLGQNKIYFGSTASLIKNSKLVFCHQSTSMSFAVLWEKPIIFLTTEEIRRSWIGPHIKLRSNLLKSKLIDIDIKSTESLAFEDFNCIDKSSYQNYKENFIKMSRSPDKCIWDLLMENFIRPIGFNSGLHFEHDEP